ncbi:MAG: formylglycine-generating enzyme family protein [Desulfobacterales bacterium]|nr:formylglycine-generating enzyme family protein [Desulfobacterales bacterium]
MSKRIKTLSILLFIIMIISLLNYSSILAEKIELPKISPEEFKVMAVPCPECKCPQCKECLACSPCTSSKENQNEKKEQIDGPYGMKFVYIHPGSFEMGSPVNELGRDDGDEAQHKVILTKGFYIQTTEVTQKQWREVMGSDPSDLYHKGCDNCPVERVTWHEVQNFIAKLNNKLNTDKYRLPTEAEWEYVARAGKDTAFANGNITQTGCEKGDPNLDKMGWYCGNANGNTHPVAQKKPNAWGLYDMHGNVWEWCQDCYEKYPTGSVTDPPRSVTDPKCSFRVFRGGGWDYGAKNCRSAYRRRSLPEVRDGLLGFRLAASPIGH